MKTPTEYPNAKGLSINTLTAILRREQLAEADKEFKKHKKLRQAKREAIKARVIPEFGQDPMPSITLINERHLPDPKIWGKEVDLVPEEYRLPIMLEALIPHFIFLCCIAFIALFDY